MSLLEDIVQALKLAEKPKFDQVMTTFKVTMAGFLIVGIIGFIIQLTATLLSTG